MKTLQELYTEIISSDELKKAYLEAAKGGKLAEFLKANGCEATAEEIAAFLKEKSGQQLSEEELDYVAGGTCNTETTKEAIYSTLSLGLACAAIALGSAFAEPDKVGHTGQQNEKEGRLCNEN